MLRSRSDRAGAAPLCRRPGPALRPAGAASERREVRPHARRSRRRRERASAGLRATPPTCSTARRSSGWLGHLGSLLAAAVADPERRLSELPLLTPAERAQALARRGEPAGLAVPCGRRRVHERFAACGAADAARAWRRRTRGESLTYGELDDRADRLARRAAAGGRGAGEPGGRLSASARWSWWSALLGSAQGGRRLRAARSRAPADGWPSCWRTRGSRRW